MVFPIGLAAKLPKSVSTSSDRIELGSNILLSKLYTTPKINHFNSYTIKNKSFLLVDDAALSGARHGDKEIAIVC
jgi:hypothetical protein